MLLNVGSGGGAAPAAGGAAAGGAADAGAAPAEEEKEEGRCRALHTRKQRLTILQRRRSQTTTWASVSSTKYVPFFGFFGIRLCGVFKMGVEKLAENVYNNQK